MRSSATIGGVGLALLGLLVVVWRLLASPTPTLPTSAGVRPGAEAAAALPMRGTTDAEPATPGNTPATSQRDVVPAAPSVAATCRIRVVDATSGAPVPDARVWLQREDAPCTSPPWRRAIQRSNDVEVTLRDGLGHELELDARGEVLVPRPTRWLCVAAARGALHGTATLQREDAECVIELEPYHALEVEVVDASGRPLEGAHVAFYGDELAEIRGTVTLIAGADGRISIPRLESAVWMRSGGPPMRLALAGGAACEPESVTLALDALPAAPVRLEAAEHGSLVVQLTDAHGKELALDGRCEVELLWDPALELSPARRAGDLEEHLHDGRVVFECVGLGLSLDVFVAAEGHTGESRTVSGPRDPGESVLVQVPIGEPFVGVRGRVHGLRACFGDTRDYEVRLTGHLDSPQAGFSAFVSEDADFEGQLSNVGTLEGLARPWGLELSRRGKPTARVSAVPVLEAGAKALDFGLLTFEPAPVLARARVRNDSGAPAPDAWVEIESGAERSRGSCDEAGLCLVSAGDATLPARVRATHQRSLPSPWVQIDAEGSEVELNLRRGARLDGRLLLARAVELAAFQIVLRVEPSTPNVPPQEVSVEPVQGGRFRLAPCEPGLASLSVRYRRRVVFERKGIAIAGDVELEPIDLRAVLHPFELTFELASGEPFGGGHLELIEAGSERRLRTEIGHSARASFLAPQPSVDLWVAARGARVQRFEGVLDGDHLTLPAAPSVRLCLPPDVPRPAAPLVLLVRGAWSSDEVPEFETDDDLDVQEAIVGEDGSAWLRMPRPGPYELAWVVRHARSGVEVEVEQAEPQTIEVPDSAEIPSLEARLTGAELEPALAEAGD